MIQVPCVLMNYVYISIIQKIVVHSFCFKKIMSFLCVIVLHFLFSKFLSFTIHNMSSSNVFSMTFQNPKLVMKYNLIYYFDFDGDEAK